MLFKCNPLFAGFTHGHVKVSRTQPAL